MGFRTPPKPVPHRQQSIFFPPVALVSLLVLVVGGISVVRSFTKSRVTKAFLSPVAQNGRPVLSVTKIAESPWQFDGRLVSLRASMAFGWEGDNFLFDNLGDEDGTFAYDKPKVWIYCRPGYEKCVGDLFSAGRTPRTYVGYFHFVANQEGRANAVFDPGPLQLEVIAATTDSGW